MLLWMSRRRGRPNRQWSQETWQKGQKLKAPDKIRSRRALWARGLGLVGTADFRSAEASRESTSSPERALPIVSGPSQPASIPRILLYRNLVFPLRGFAFCSAVQESFCSFPARPLRLNAVSGVSRRVPLNLSFLKFLRSFQCRSLRLARSGAYSGSRHSLPVAG